MATRPPVLVALRDGYSPMPRQIPSSVMARVLAASTAESITVPAGARWVVFSCTASFYVNCYTTATVPAADVTDGTASELNPSAYELPLTDVPAISVISGSACVLTAAFYA